jgi:GT2 family glycosyltransferase
VNGSAIILVNWNGWRDTVECLASLQRLTPPPGLVVVVDNASSDGSLERIAAWCAGRESAQRQSEDPSLPSFELRAPAELEWAQLDEGQHWRPGLPQLLLIAGRRNHGFAGGNNIGLRLAREAGAQGFWLLNTDTVVSPDALAALEARAMAVPGAGMVGSTLLYYWRPHEVQALGGARFDRRTGAASHIGIGSAVAAVPVDPTTVEAACDYIIGASLFATRSFVDAVGDMCEDYFLYFEEIDWALRGAGRFSLAWAPASVVFHKVGGSSRRTASRQALRYLYRNRLRVMQRFFPNALGSTRRHMYLQVLQHARRGHWDDVRELASALARGPR